MIKYVKTGKMEINFLHSSKKDLQVLYFVIIIAVSLTKGNIPLHRDTINVYT